LARWLLKTEPDCYSFADLQKEKKAVWDGITNTTALKHMRTMRKGDEVVIYHTGNERAAVGLAMITRDPYPDPKEDDEKLVVIDLKPGKPLARPVSLSEIKEDPAFDGWDLLRISRLSVVPIPQGMWDRLLKMSAAK
jgi:predicted RNA-binding protein with PUA-like domain